MIYVLTYSTESGDEGVLCAFRKEPTPRQINEAVSEAMPEDFEAGTIYPEVTSVFLED